MLGENIFFSPTEEDVLERFKTKLENMNDHDIRSQERNIYILENKTQIFRHHKKFRCTKCHKTMIIVEGADMPFRNYPLVQCPECNTANILVD